MNPSKALAVALSAGMILPGSALAGPNAASSASNGVAFVYTGTRSMTMPSTETGTAVIETGTMAIPKLSDMRMDGVALIYTGTRMSPGVETGTAIALPASAVRSDGIAAAYTGTRTLPSTETGTAMVKVDPAKPFSAPASPQLALADSAGLSIILSAAMLLRSITGRGIR